MANGAAAAGREQAQCPRPDGDFGQILKITSNTLIPCPTCVYYSIDVFSNVGMDFVCNSVEK